MTAPDPCRSCDSDSISDAWHVYGETKCCPDCDHRPIPEEQEQ